MLLILILILSKNQEPRTVPLILINAPQAPQADTDANPPRDRTMKKSLLLLSLIHI